MHENLDYESWMDDADVAWLNSFIGPDHKIKPDCTVEGFVAVISFIDGDGNPRFHKYNCLERPLSSIVGLLDLAKHEYLMDNTAISPKQVREEE